MARSLRFKDVRDIKITLVHPHDHDGIEIVNQIERIGCQVQHLWQANQVINVETEVLIAGIFKENINSIKSQIKNSGNDVTTIAVLDYESPTTLEMAIDLNAVAIISKPVRSFGIFANLVIARWNWNREQKLKKRIHRLERLVSSKTLVNKAVLIIMNTQRLSEDDAYKLIRTQAMSKRTSIKNIAEAIINTEDLLTPK